MAVSAAGSQKLTLYDLSNPADPTPLSVLDLDVVRAAIWYPFVWAARQTAGVHTFDISDPTNPIPFGEDVWASNQPWNSHDCEWTYDAAFHPTGSVLYAARYSVLQKFTLCSPPGGW